MQWYPSSPNSSLNRCTLSPGQVPRSIELPSLRGKLQSVVDGLIYEPEEEKPVCPKEAARDQKRARVLKSWEQAFTFTEEDVAKLADDGDSFHKLQQALRKKGCVTNAYLQQNFHHYVFNVKRAESRRRRKEMVTANA